MKILEATQMIHEHAKAKGWWESARDQDTIFQLIVSEVAEASEEVRANRPALYFNDFEGTPRQIDDLQDFPDGEKPEGESVELADAFIRALDYAGYCGLNLNPPDNGDTEINDLIAWAQDPNTEKGYYQEVSPLAAHFDISKPLFMIHNTENALFQHIVKIARYFDHKGWNLDDIVQLKVAYNQRRSYRHGGKLY